MSAKSFFKTFNGVVILFLGSIIFGCNSKELAQKQKEIDSLKNEISILKLQKLQYRNNYIEDPTIGQSNPIVSNDYFLMSKEDLLEKFKDYMSDKYFEIESFKVAGNTIRVHVGIVMNISIRALERDNPSLFNELLTRYSKIVFWDEFGKSVTLSKRASS